MTRDDHLIVEAFIKKMHKNTDDEEGDLMTHMKEKGMISKDARVTLPPHKTEEAESKFASEKPVTSHLISQLRLMHDRLNEMSTAISLSRSPEIDQLLSHIRDLADMLITDQPNKSEEENNIPPPPDEIRPILKTANVPPPPKEPGDGRPYLSAA